jgi:hypothetical protein
VFAASLFVVVVALRFLCSAFTPFFCFVLSLACVCSGVTGRQLLVRILSTLVNKFDTLKDAVPRILESWQAARATKEQSNSTSAAAAAAKESPLVITTSASRANASSSAFDADEEVGVGAGVGVGGPVTDESLKEYKTLMFTMVFGLKTVGWCILNYRSPSLVPGVAAKKMDDEEIAIVARFLEYGMCVCWIVVLYECPQPNSVWSGAV